MNKDLFKGKWHEYKGKIKEKWGKLTDNDLTEINGKREALLGKLQSQYGYAKDRAETELKKFENDFEEPAESEEFEEPEELDESEDIRKS